MKRRLTALTVAALAIAAGTALGSPAGDLDPSFDNDGKRVLPDLRKVNDLLVQPDRKIIAVAETSTGDFHVVRLDLTGSRDKSFAGDGTAIVDFGGDDRPYAAALQADGKIVVAGETRLPNAAPQVAVARLTTAGQIDPTFDPSGPDGDGDGKKVFEKTPGGTFQYEAKAVLVQEDGKIVLAGDGASPEQDIAVTRLTAGGAIDGTQFDLPKLGALDMQDAALTPDGKLVIASTRFAPAERPAIAITRYGTDGKLDKTLGGMGNATYKSGEDELPATVLVQPDGKIVVAGAAGSTTDPAMVVTRFNRDGAPDASFDGDGRASAGFDGQNAAAAVALQPDGKIVVAGTTLPIEFALARFTKDGALDPGFGSGGRATIDFGDKGAASAIAVQADGRVVVAGQLLQFGAGVARLLPDPPPVTGVGPNPVPNPDAKPKSRPRCGDRPATIIGTAGPDRLRGTPRADVIVTLGGNDRVSGRGGRDLLCGGEGKDRLDGGRGRDVLSGGAGRDLLVGGPARDRCTGGAAHDRSRSCETRSTL